MSPKQIKVTQTRSRIGVQSPLRRTLTALGLTRHQQSVVHEDTPQIRGMINKVRHLVEVEEA